MFCLTLTLKRGTRKGFLGANLLFRVGCHGLLGDFVYFYSAPNHFFDLKYFVWVKPSEQVVNLRIAITAKIESSL